MKTTMLLTAALCGVLTLAPRAHSQSREGAVPPGNNLPAQPIGPSDLLGLSVYGAPEFTRTIRVSEDGNIRLPMLKEPIEVRGLMPGKLEERIAETLSKEGILVDRKSVV